jgi:hypothetical protein
MAEDVKQLLLQVDASVELMRRQLNSGITSLNQFENAADKTANSVTGAFGKIDRAAGVARTAIVGFAAGIGIQGIASVSRAILQLGDDLDAAAQQANISVERYQTLKEGLRALEVNAEQADKIFKSLSDTLGAVQGGTAAAGVADALERMGVRSRILNGEIDTTDELLDAIAGSASRFRTEAEFTAAVVDVVGKKLGVDLAAALRDGGKALKEQEQNFRDAGGVIDSEYIKRLADANEAIDAFTSRAKGKLAIWAAESIRAFQDLGSVMAAFSAGGFSAGIDAGQAFGKLRRADAEQSALNSVIQRQGANSLSAFTRLSQTGGARRPAVSASAGGGGRSAARGGGRSRGASLSPAAARLAGVPASVG